MAFVVEDGSGRSDATSLLSVADFQAYHDDRGNDYSSYSSTEQEQALVKASTFLTAAYDWVGRPTEIDQALCWPRIGAYDRNQYAIEEDEIPLPVTQACAELAFRALSEDIYADIDRAMKSFKAGSLSVEWEEGTSIPRTYRIINDLLKGLALSSGGVTVRLDLA